MSPRFVILIARRQFAPNKLIAAAEMVYRVRAALTARVNIVNAAESTSHAGRERRATPRTRLQKLAYIHVEPDNGVIVLDVSSGGIRFCAATALADTDVLRLQLSLQNNLRVAVTAKLVWMDPSMKSGGLQFDALPAGGLERVVRDWLDYSGLPTHAGRTISPWPSSPNQPPNQPSNAPLSTSPNTPLSMSPNQSPGTPPDTSFSLPILATIPPPPRVTSAPATSSIPAITDSELPALKTLAAAPVAPVAPAPLQEPAQAPVPTEAAARVEPRAPVETPVPVEVPVPVEARVPVDEATAPPEAKTPATKSLSPEQEPEQGIAAASAEASAEGPGKGPEKEPGKGPHNNEAAAPPPVSAVPELSPAADLPATKIPEPPPAKPVEAVVPQPFVSEKKLLAPPPPPPAAAAPIAVIPKAQATPAASAANGASPANRASATQNPARAIAIVPPPPPATAPAKTAAIARQPRPAPKSLRKIPAPAPSPIVARAKASLLKKAKPKEWIGVGVAALLLLAILVSLPALFGNKFGYKPATSAALASVSATSPQADETLAPALAASAGPGATAQNPSRVYNAAAASAAADSDPDDENPGASANPAIAKTLKAAPDSAFAPTGASVSRARSGAADDPAALTRSAAGGASGAKNGATASARDLRASPVAGGFGTPVAVPLAGISSAARAGVQVGEFNSASGLSVAPPATSKASAASVAGVVPATAAAAIQPAVIFDKPSPVYTEEARKLAIEGEVTLDVIFSGSGQVQVLRVLKSLGHGLDESAINAAQQIRFRPAMQNGQAVDFPATIHITFQLAF